MVPSSALLPSQAQIKSKDKALMKEVAAFAEREAEQVRYRRADECRDIHRVMVSVKQWLMGCRVLGFVCIRHEASSSFVLRKCRRICFANTHHVASLDRALALIYLRR